MYICLDSSNLRHLAIVLSIVYLTYNSQKTN